MANLTLASCQDAAFVQLKGLGVALQAARALENEPETERLVTAILHLGLALESAARLPAGSVEQDAVLAYLTEAYALRTTLTDPLLRAQLPPVPAAGAMVRYKVLALNGRALVLNGNKLAVVDARLTSTPLLS